MSTEVPAPRDFFALEGAPKDVDQEAFTALLDQKPQLCENLIYRPNKLENPYPPGRFRVKGITFRNVSFSHTVISRFEFTSCTFERCLFIGTIFADCRFTSCTFNDSNPHRMEFDQCFVDPKSFGACVCSPSFANIGVYLFQELLRNSRQQAQPEFSDQAQYEFKKWQRCQLGQELVEKRGKEKLGMYVRMCGLKFFDLLSGSGTRLDRLAISSFSVLLLFAFLNWMLAGQMGLQSNHTVVRSFIDAFYFSTVITTTLGFGDISPTTAFGRLMVSGEAIIGFVLFALLTSTLYRKMTA